MRTHTHPSVVLTAGPRWSACTEGNDLGAQSSDASLASLMSSCFMQSERPNKRHNQKRGPEAWGRLRAASCPGGGRGGH